VEQEQPQRPQAPAQPAEPHFVGVVSGKGGCGKSTIASSMAVVLSALKGSAALVDMDVVNRSSTQILLTQYHSHWLTSSELATVLDCLVEDPDRCGLVPMEWLPGKRFSIQVAGDSSRGVGAKDLYVLPAARADPLQGNLLKRFGLMTREEVRMAVERLVQAVRSVARRKRIPYVVFDYPPLRPEGRRVLEGVYAALEYMDSFVLVVPYDAAALSGLIALVEERYNYIKARTRGFFINMASGSGRLAEEMVDYIYRVYGDVPVAFIRRDRLWTVNDIPPVVLGDPSKGATHDLLMAMVAAGLLTAEDLRALGLTAEAEAGK